MFLSKSTLSLLLLFVFLVVTVRSQDDEPSFIRLPTDDLCVRSAPPTSCPVNCFTTHPVCGVNGVTYWCGCGDALCAGTKVAKLGFCEVGNNGGTAPLSGQALLLVHIVWLIVLGFSVLFGLF